MKEVPKGWVRVRMQDLASINPPKIKPDLEDRTPLVFVPMPKVAEDFRGIDVSGRRPLSSIKRGYTQFRPGDVLFAKITPCMENGKIAIVPEIRPPLGYGSTEFFVMRSRTDGIGRWIAYCVARSSFRQLARENMQGAVGQRRVPRVWLENASVPLAPLSEQHRIVARIESLFARLDEGLAALKRAQANLERYRASVLKAAVEGNLTERWRRENPPCETGEDLLQRILAERRRRWETEQLAKFEAKGRKPPRNWKAKYKAPVEPDTSRLPGLPEGWCWATVDQVIVAMMNGYGKRSNTSGGTPRMVLRLADVRQHQISYRNPRYLDCTSEQTTKYKLDDGDVLIVRVNGSADLVGRMVDCRGVLGDVLFCDHFIRAKCMTADTATWLRMCSDTERFRSHVERTKVSTAGQHTVSQGVILPFAFPLPPEREALAIMKLVDHLALHSKPVESALIDGRVSAFRLRQSILKRAFEGRLVPQDPADEPASVILDRIRAQRRVRS